MTQLDDTRPHPHDAGHDDYGREGIPTGDLVPLTQAQIRARRGRNWAIAAAVVLFICLVFATTYFRLQDAVKLGLTG